jgi:hypothetical protein
MLFQSRREGLERPFAYRVDQAKILQLSPDDSVVNERHPALLESSESKLVVLFGSGSDSSPSGFERLKVRTWPSMATEDLLIDPNLGGAIPAVRDGRIVFSGFGRSGPAAVPNLMALEPG